MSFGIDIDICDEMSEVVLGGDYAIRTYVVIPAECIAPTFEAL